jgi:predicted nucleic acid-binding protein
MLLWPVPPGPGSLQVARTIRSGVDCLIAAGAIRNSGSVLHLDRDFDSIAEIPGLDSRCLS